MLSAVSVDGILSVVSGWIHVSSIAIVVGGTFFLRQTVSPAAEGLLDGETHELLREQMRARWGRVVHAAVGLIILTGFYNFYVAVAIDKRAGAYHMIFGVKFIAAIALLFIAVALSSRSDAFARFRRNARTWSGISLLLAAIIILLSNMLKQIDRLAG